VMLFSSSFLVCYFWHHFPSEYAAFLLSSCKHAVCINMPFACNSFSNLLRVYSCVCPIPSQFFWFVQFPLESSVTFEILRWTIFHIIRWKIENACNLKTRRNIQDFPPKYFSSTRS
jgi:hypothetical protein